MRADEDIVHLKKMVRNQQFKDIETTGIYIHDKLTKFSKNYLFNDRIVAFIPTDFIDMPEAIYQMKYPSVNRPDIIKTSLDTTVNFSYKWFDQKIEYRRMEELAEQLKQVLKTANPRIKFGREEAVDTLSGNRLSLFNFFNNGIDERIYNLFCIMNMSQGVIQATFNCLEQDSEQWEDAAWSVFTRLEEIKV